MNALDPNQFEITRQTLTELAQQRIPQRIRQRDHTVWRPDPREIADRLGWLDAGEFLQPHLPELTAFTQEIRQANIQDIVLLGMGGSSLGPEMLRRALLPPPTPHAPNHPNAADTPGIPNPPGTANAADAPNPPDLAAIPPHPRLTLLDSTVPEQIANVTANINPTQTLFIVSSKSGATIETLSLYHYFRAQVESAIANAANNPTADTNAANDPIANAETNPAAPNADNNPAAITAAGNHFVAITDPGTPLEQLAQQANFRRTFLNPPDIGGRFSVLSWFGMLPAALAGIDLPQLLHHAAQMRDQCLTGPPNQDNPGLTLGALLGAMAQAGRDKMTLITPPPLDSFGLWVEQMIAESLGKDGRGIIPIANEPLLPPTAYHHDRLFIYLRVTPDTPHAAAQQPDPAPYDEAVAQLEAAGHPVARLTLTHPYELGAEIYRWEYATAVAAAILNVHPFDQPDVQGAKDNTDRLLAAHRNPANANAVNPGPSNNDADANPTLLPPPPPDGSLSTLLQQSQPGDYLALILYAPNNHNPDHPLEQALTQLRAKIMHRYRLATTIGYGPRYLHSSGQLHKGGPNTGLYLQLLPPDHHPRLPIPQQNYDFALLATLQATGDRQSLTALNRRLTTINLGPDAPQTIRRLINELP